MKRNLILRAVSLKQCQYVVNFRATRVVITITLVQLLGLYIANSWLVNLSSPWSYSSHWKNSKIESTPENIRNICLRKIVTGPRAKTLSDELFFKMRQMLSFVCHQTYGLCSRLHTHYFFIFLTELLPSGDTGWFNGNKSTYFCWFIPTNFVNLVKLLILFLEIKSVCRKKINLIKELFFSVCQ